MSIPNLKLWRTVSLLLCAVAVAVAFSTFSPGGSDGYFFFGCLVAISSLGFFVFTEAFLLPEPHRTRGDIWLARAFFAIVVLAILGLSLTLLTGT